MGKREKDKRNLRRSVAGLCVFVLVLPCLWRVGGAKLALQEILPGQVSTASLSFTDTDKANSTETPMPEGKTVMGIEDIDFTKTSTPNSSYNKAELAEQMKDFASLKNNFYVVDSRTTFLKEDIDVPHALERDFSIDRSTKGPQILIFHTHSHEEYADSDMSKGIQEGIWGVGERLKELLEKKGIQVLHDTGQYDLVDGKRTVLGSYERMEDPIQKILKENPSIQVCIDMHRDGVAEGTKLVTEVNGKPCAKIMFFNGLCRLNKDGNIQPTEGLSNPYVKDNLEFSLQMQAVSRAMFGNFNRKIYLNAYRFSLHFMPRATLIEVGAQTNTKEEALNAMEPLSEILAEVLL